MTQNWILEKRCKQDELETRLRFFTFVDQEEGKAAEKHAEENIKKKLVLGSSGGRGEDEELYGRQKTQAII